MASLSHDYHHLSFQLMSVHGGKFTRHNNNAAATTTITTVAQTQ